MTYQSWTVVFGEQPAASKWNILGTNDAHFYSFLGDNLAWQSFTPSWTNITVGNGTNQGYQTQVGKTVILRVKFILGSTSSIGGNVLLTLPVTASSNLYVADVTPIGMLAVLDTGTASFQGHFNFTSTTTSRPVVANSASTYATDNAVNATTPMAVPATGDSIHGLIIYEAA